MDNEDNLTGKIARLPDGQKVKIEATYSDGYATVRRIDGERKGMVAVCAISSLQFDPRIARAEG